MSTNRISNQQNTAGNNEPVSERIWFVGALNLLMLLVLMFFVEVSSVKADGLFDFQMTLAKKGNAEAQFKVGEMYETGFGVKKSMKEAELWTKKAAQQGNEAAGFKLLYWDMKKNGITSNNKAKHQELVKKAEAENGQAMYYVGKMYAEGVGVKKDYDNALIWLNKATFIGVLEAEREAVALREVKQRSSAQARRDEEKKKAAAAAAAAASAAAAADAKRQKEAKRAKAAKAQKKTEESRNNEDAVAANAAAEAERKAEIERQKAEKVAKQKEKKRQALLKQRAEQTKERKAKFESDPCSGKSARFLSTCR